MQLARLLLQMILGIGLTYALQRWDWGRLSKEQRAEAWNSATWSAAVLVFGTLSMLGWGWVTRRGKGLVLGALCVIALSIVRILVDVAFAMSFGLPLEEDLFG